MKINQNMLKTSSDFCCEKCNYITNKKNNYNRHLISTRHSKSTAVNQNMLKTSSENNNEEPDCLNDDKNNYIDNLLESKTQNQPSLLKICSTFCCKTCCYITSKKSSYDAHLISTKHNKIMSNQFICDVCLKKYKDKSGLWRHKKKCLPLEVINKNTTEINNDLFNKELILMLVKQNTETLEILKNGTNSNNNSNNNINNNNNNNNNKTFNLQFFLNETCKDAMNINEFVENITIQLSDLIKVGELGYVDGISNIITSSLKSLDVTQRPIHCTDKKREVLYVKEEDKWEKENDEKTKIRKVIKTVAHKNINALPQFNEKYPDCKQGHSQYSDQYNKIIIETMGGFGENNIEKENNIIKNISKNVIVDKENNDV